MSYQNQLKFRAQQMVVIGRSSFYQELPKSLRNSIDLCKREGISLNTLLNEGVAIDREVHQRIQLFLTVTRDCIASIRDAISNEHCEIDEIMPYVEFENKLIMYFIDEVLKESTF